MGLIKPSGSSVYTDEIYTAGGIGVPVTVGEADEKGRKRLTITGSLNAIAADITKGKKAITNEGIVDGTLEPASTMAVAANVVNKRNDNILVEVWGVDALSYIGSSNEEQMRKWLTKYTVAGGATQKINSIYSIINGNEYAPMALVVRDSSDNVLTIHAPAFISYGKHSSQSTPCFTLTIY